MSDEKSPILKATRLAYIPFISPAHPQKANNGEVEKPFTDEAAELHRCLATQSLVSVSVCNFTGHIQETLKAKRKHEVNYKIMEKVCMLIAMETLEVRSFVKRSHLNVSYEAKFTLSANYTLSSNAGVYLLVTTRTNHSGKNNR